MSTAATPGSSSDNEQESALAGAVHTVAGLLAPLTTRYPSVYGEHVVGQSLTPTTS